MDKDIICQVVWWIRHYLNPTKGRDPESYVTHLLKDDGGPMTVSQVNHNAVACCLVGSATASCVKQS